MLLRDQPIGTTADLSDFAVAWWNGHNVMWVEAPKFSARDEVLRRLKDAPPNEAA
jgi:hypothetical protein